MYKYRMGIGNDGFNPLAYCKDLLILKRYACDVLPLTFNISVFKSSENNSTTVKHIYNESANIIEGCQVAFDTIDCWNFP